MAAVAKKQVLREKLITFYELLLQVTQKITVS